MLLQIVHFYKSNTGGIVYTAYDRGVVTRLQRRDNRRLAWLSGSVPAVLDGADLAGRDDPPDYGRLPVVIRGN